MLRNYCPCCGNPLLRHARQGRVYWFCTSCRQDMPASLSSNLSGLDSPSTRSRIIQTANS